MRTDLPRVYDACLAAAIAGAGLAETWVPFESRQGDGSAEVTSLAIVVASVALTQRRRHPLAAGLVVLVVWPLLALVAPLYILFFGQFLPMAIAVFSMARHGPGPVPYYGAAAGAATLLGVDLLIEELQSPGEIFFHWFVFIVVWGFGFGLRRMEQRARRATRRAVEAEVAAAEQSMAAVLEERTRIARELHDIVAHSVTMMVVQAGAAEQVVDDDPAYVRRALGAIRDTGTGAIAEMRRVVAMLRDDDGLGYEGLDQGELGSLAPQPGIGTLGTLVEDARSSALAVTLEVAGEERPLPSGVDLAAYRIIQEALTNVRRHAAASCVQVRLRYGADDLRIEVADDGVGSADPHGGHGLVGMRERASLYGGRIETASVDGSGFVVRAYLPTECTP